MGFNAGHPDEVSGARSWTGVGHGHWVVESGRGSEFNGLFLGFSIH